MIRIKQLTVIALTFFAWIAPGALHAQGPEPINHASAELMQLVQDFRDFRSTLFRPRTWRPTGSQTGVPDYAAVKRDQIAGLAEFRRRLNAFDPSAWPVHDQVDFLLLRSEMDDVYFEQHILREVETNPGYYVEQAVNGVAREMRDVVPYSDEKADAIIAAFERTAGIVEQGPRNIILADAAPVRPVARDPVGRGADRRRSGLSRPGG